MNAGLIASRYATAFFQSGQSDPAVLERLYKDAAYLLDLLRQGKDLEQFLTNPLIKPGARKKALAQILGSSLHPFSLGLLKVLIDNQREGLLNLVLLDFSTLYRRHKDLRQVVVQTAVPVDKDLRAQLKKMVEDQFACRAELDCKVDPELMGGLILRMDDRQLDGSVRGQLRAMKKKLLALR